MWTDTEFQERWKITNLMGKDPLLCLIKDGMRSYLALGQRRSRRQIFENWNFCIRTITCTDTPNYCHALTRNNFHVVWYISCLYQNKYPYKPLVIHRIPFNYSSIYIKYNHKYILRRELGYYICSFNKFI